MPTYSHDKIVEQIRELDEVPDDSAAFANWILAARHLEFLRQNAQSDEVVIYGSGNYSFIYTAVVPNQHLESLEENDLLHWDGSPFWSIAGYVWGGGREDVWIERLAHSAGSRTLRSATQLVFVRTFDGSSDSDRTYFEINQEYTHVTGIHWRPEASKGDGGIIS